jgi:hypothetical protein
VLVRHAAFSVNAILAICVICAGLAPLPALAQNSGASKEASAQPSLFTDKDRQALQHWYRTHHDQLPREFVAREHWSPTFEGRLKIGSVIDKDIRPWAYPLPDDLLTQMPPQPRHFRYVIIGEHACIIDASWRLYDVFHFHS